MIQNHIATPFDAQPPIAFASCHELVTALRLVAMRRNLRPLTVLAAPYGTVHP